MPTMSQLDQPQVIKSVYDATNQALQVNVVATAIAAASAVKITDGSGSGDNATVTAAKALKVDGSAVTQPVSAAALPLPSGAATSANQTTEITALGTINTTLGSPMQATGGSVKTVGYTLHEFVRNDYTGTSVTTAAYVQLIASTSTAYEEFEIFDSSGQTLKIAFGAAASEVDQFLVYPGGNGRVLHHVNSGVRVSIKAVSATASVGELDINLRG